MTLYSRTDNADGSILFSPAKPPAPVLTEGIDVSLYQGIINWASVKSQKTFAFIKATQGNSITDPKFSTNWSGAKAVGIPRGAYHFYQFRFDPISQANLFCSKLVTDKGELPPVVDVEDTATPANASQLKLFIDTVTSSLGIRPIIYTGSWWWTNARWGGSVPWAKDYALWVAYYSLTAAVPVLPTDWKTYQYWQYTSSGVVAGISGNVDLNRYNGVV